VLGFSILNMFKGEEYKILVANIDDSRNRNNDSSLSIQQITDDVVDELDDWASPYNNIKISKEEHVSNKNLQECNNENNINLLICVRYDSQINRIKIYSKEILSRHEIPSIQYKDIKTKFRKNLCNKLDLNIDEIFFPKMLQIEGSGNAATDNRKLLSQFNAEIMYWVSFYLAVDQLRIGAKDAAVELLDRVEQKTRDSNKYENSGRIWVYKSISNLIKNNFLEADQNINLAINYFQKKEPRLNEFIKTLESDKQYDLKNKNVVQNFHLDNRSEIATSLMLKGILYAFIPNPRYDTALKFIDGSITLDNIPDSLNTRGVILSKLKKYDEAEQAYQSASVDSNPFKYRAYYNLGELYFERDGLYGIGKSIKNFEKAKDIKPNYIQAYLRLGIINDENMNRPRDAITFFDSVLSIDRFNLNALEYRANSYIKLNKYNSYSKAIEDYKQLIELCPKDSSRYISQIETASKLRDKISR
jgi:tetratricopeptide (TPR) repeat protein